MGAYLRLPLISLVLLSQFQSQNCKIERGGAAVIQDDDDAQELPAWASGKYCYRLRLAVVQHPVPTQQKVNRAR